MNKFICILLLAVVIANAQDIPWDGNYTMLNVTNINGTDPGQCCVPSALNIVRDPSNPKLITLDMDFAAGSPQCDPTLIGMITTQQEETFGRLFLNDSSTTLTGANVAYLLNNGTILLQLQDGCHIYYGNGTVAAPQTNYVERYQGIFVVESFWSADENPCCMVLQPVPNAYDDLTKTEAYIDAYPDDPVCAERRGTFRANNNSVDGFGVIIGNFSEFNLPNGSLITISPPPYCTVLYSLKKPTLSTNLCDYVNATTGNNTAATGNNTEAVPTEGESTTETPTSTTDGTTTNGGTTTESTPIEGV